MIVRTDDHDAQKVGWRRVFMIRHRYKRMLCRDAGCKMILMRFCFGRCEAFCRASHDGCCCPPPATSPLPRHPRIETVSQSHCSIQLDFFCSDPRLASSAAAAALHARSRLMYSSRRGLDDCTRTCIRAYAFILLFFCPCFVADDAARRNKMAAAEPRCSNPLTIRVAAAARQL